MPTGVYERKPKKKRPLMERFKEQVNFDGAGGCHIWGASKSPNGYGKIYVEGKTESAHRTSFKLFNGSIPDGMCICHSCDNKLCVNPKHLFLGTQADNIRDRDSKNRQARQRGESCGTAKLTEYQIHKIRRDPRTQDVIAKEFGVSQTQISRIKRRKRWNHI